VKVKVTKEDGKEIVIKMELHEYIAMSLGYKIRTDINLDTDKAKDYVNTAMAAAGYKEVAYPNHENFRVSIAGGKRKSSKKTRKSKNLSLHP
jgi:hypothetical protein